MDEITAADRVAIERLVNEAGHREAAKRLGVGVDSILRVLAKRPVRKGTVALIRMALETEAVSR